MNVEPTIRVGLITGGPPQLSQAGHGLTRIGNILIGEGFHWQKEIKILVEGSVEPIDSPQGNIHAVNTLGLESYIKSVIGSEMNPNAPTEFLKAHAIISRSWALRKLPAAGTSHTPAPGRDAPVAWEESDAHHGFDVCSDDHCQRYQGVAAGNKLMGSIVEATHGLVLSAPDGSVVDTRFSKCCGGRTEVFSSCWADTDMPCLISVADPHCDLSELTPSERKEFLKACLKDYDLDDDPHNNYMHWQADVDADELRRRIEAKYGVDTGTVRTIIPAVIGKSGRIVTLRIEGETCSMEIGKTLAIRRLLSSSCLRSSRFAITRTPSGFHLNGQGWGHGVGLCQIGAARMARDGADHREILSFYYPGSYITKAYD